MKRIGILGGMSPESTLRYYERINRQVNELAQDNELGEHISADMVLRSVNFEEYCKRMESGDWQEIANMIDEEVVNLVHNDGCDFVAIATNTMHKVVKDTVPQLVHIGDCVAEECIESGFKRVANVGTKTTMKEDFMKDRLRKHGLEVVDTFTEEEIAEIDRIIFEELCHGEVDDESRHTILNAVVRADSRDMDNGGSGFDAVILGCTELELLFDEGLEYIIGKPKYHHHFEFVNSTQAHIDKLVDLCLS